MGSLINKDLEQVTTSMGFSFNLKKKTKSEGGAWGRVVNGVGLDVIKFYDSTVFISDKKVNIYISHI